MKVYLTVVEVFLDVGEHGVPVFAFVFHYHTLQYTKDSRVYYKNSVSFRKYLIQGTIKLTYAVTE